MGEIHSRLAGAFTGYHSGAIFRLTNGQVWQQRRYKYKYKYKYRPGVRIYSEQGKRLMEFDCMDEPIEVVRATVLEEGTITSDFNGFDGSAERGWLVRGHDTPPPTLSVIEDHIRLPFARWQIASC